MKASYNITNDKLKFWPDARLPEDQYKAARHAGFIWWHGSKCFAAKWSTQAEDLILGMGGVIEDDDQPDDVESRVERFSKYAERAEQKAESSQNYLDTSANTERRRKNAVNGIEKGLDEARHWQERIQGAIRAASYKEKPDVIARRIRGLESDLARYVNKSTVYEPQPVCGQGADQVWVGKGRGGYWATQDKFEGIKAHYARWIEHAKRRIEYEMACLEAAGGCHDVLRPKRKIAVMPKGKAKARDGKALEVGGAVGCNYSYSSRPEDMSWRLIAGVNRSTVDIYSVGKITGGDGQVKDQYSKHRRAAYECETAKTAAEVKAEMPELYAHWVKVNELVKRIAERKAAKLAQAEQVAA